MARLIVDAVSREFKSSDIVWHLAMFVSVSRSDDGTPVTGLTRDNFRVCSALGLVLDMNLYGGYEASWEPGDAEPAGCYTLSVTRKWEHGGPPISEWTQGEFYPFGIQACVVDKESGEELVGQTVLRIESLGR